MASNIMDRVPGLLAPIALVYTQRLRDWGPSPRGVFWRDAAGQQLRFEVLAGVLGDDAHVGGAAVNDLGCGYGALHGFLEGLKPAGPFVYHGYDISEDMLILARQRIKDPAATFEISPIALSTADYSIASGTFNMKMAAQPAEWDEYIRASLVHLWSRSTKGMAFNMLDHKNPHQESGLYYADPAAYLEFCRREISPDARLVDDYPLKEWSILMRRESTAG